MIYVSKNHEGDNANMVLISGLVTVLQTPISERYCKIGDTATLDVKNKQIRCGGAWFNFDERWVVRPLN
jgi:hypothetical protein